MGRVPHGICARAGRKEGTGPHGRRTPQKCYARLSPFGNILRIALYELDRDEVPLEVAIDEAVRLARRYASEDAAKLVNGILGKVAKEAKR